MSSERRYSRTLHCRAGTAGLLAGLAMLTAACGSQTISGSAQADNAATTEGVLTRAEVATTTTTSADSGTTTPPSATATPLESAAQDEVLVDANAYAGSRPGGYYFTTPSGKFLCGIETGVLTGGPAQVGCQGSLPPTVPRLPAPGAPDNLIPANTILAVGDGEADFMNSGGVMFTPDGGAPRELPYGSLLIVEGYVCNVDPEVGVTCLTPAGHGFAVSSADFGTW